MELRWCAERGIPHSVFLTWPDIDRTKVLAITLEDGDRCQMCGTSSWEWEADQFAYVAAVHVCPGCKLREAAREDAADMTGGSIILISGEAKKAALAKQRAAYLASRGQKGRRK